MDTLYTIGFTKKNARTFFGLLVRNNVKTVLDVRLNNASQLAAFTKRDDLAYFLEIHSIGYVHLSVLAPTPEILDDYKKNKIAWSDYEHKYLRLLEERRKAITRDVEHIDLTGACLLCSEPTAENCHRRLAAEWLKSQNFVSNVVHL